MSAEGQAVDSPRSAQRDASVPEAKEPGHDASTSIFLTRDGIGALAVTCAPTGQWEASLPNSRQRHRRHWSFKARALLHKLIVIDLRAPSLRLKRLGDRLYFQPTFSFTAIQQCESSSTRI
jgi:hypothetical protein